VPRPPVRSSAAFVALLVAVVAVLVTVVAGGGVGVGVGGTGVPAASADDGPPVEIADETGLAAAERVDPIVHHRFPVISSTITFGRTHHDYPATDIAVACGTRVVAAVDGTVWEVERTDHWNPLLDIPGTRGGKTVVVDGDDHVRYLFAHFSSIASGLAVGQRVEAGQTIGAVGSTGHSTGCHLHLGLSPECPTRVWDRLAGTVWPWPYLDAWRAGEEVGPGPEVEQWAAAHPNGCDGSAVLSPPASSAGSETGVDTGVGAPGGEPPAPISMGE